LSVVDYKVDFICRCRGKYLEVRFQKEARSLEGKKVDRIISRIRATLKLSGPNSSPEFLERGGAECLLAE
jgi:hypothetical protein